MAAAVAPDASAQLARLGLSEAEFKQKTELMRLYLQDSAGASSFDEFCKRYPLKAPDAPPKARDPSPPRAPRPQKAAAPAPTKTSSKSQQKSAKQASVPPQLALPLNAQMFPVMPNGQRPMLMPPVMPGQPLPYYPPIWFNPAALAQGKSIAHPWVQPQPAAGAKQPAAPTSTTAGSSSQPKAESSDENAKMDKASPATVGSTQSPETPKTPTRQHGETSPFTPAAAAIFMSPNAGELVGTPVPAIFRPDGVIFPHPFFPSPELLRLAKPTTSHEEVDPSTIFKLPPPPYATSKPPYSYAALIGQAINASHRKRACLDHIYLYISTVYPYYKRGEHAWQNSIRHNLSQNSSFTRLKHPGGGQHGEWAIREEDAHCFANGGFNRAARPPEPNRKRRRKGAFDDDTDLEDDTSSRKRPRKHMVPSEEPEQRQAKANFKSSSQTVKHEPMDTTTSLSQPNRMDQAKSSASPVMVQKKPLAQKRQPESKPRAKAKKKRSKYESEEEMESEEFESDYGEDVFSPSYGRSKTNKTGVHSLMHRPRRTLDPDEELAVIDAILQSDAASSRAVSVAPPSETASAPPSEPEDVEIQDEDEDDTQSQARSTTHSQEPPMHHRFSQSDVRSDSNQSEKRFRTLPVSTLLNLSPMRRLSTSPMKSAIRTTKLDEAMSRFAVNNETRDEDSMSGEDFSYGPDRELDEDERDRSVTPPPLIPDPPWLHSPIPATPNKRTPPNEDDYLVSARRLPRQTSLCISPNSSHLFSQSTAFMTPARALGSDERPFDSSFPVFRPPSSPMRQHPKPSDPITPDRPPSTSKSIFLQTPLFPPPFSESRLEEELNRMARGEESPNGFFRRSDLYKSPSIPGSSPQRWGL
ncbi:SubName: Full=Uncharacterized protein {ECO:0000313/EMBL:CCA71379.1} [Serendipita indica DSM 11827]|nr:SubName: Full=Uncharacterized protein {ECO:0000313/EMBL:CCA71379.1} [Serendipita indica DSM 11827]